MKSDIEIARQSALLPIEKVAAKIGIPLDALEFYGRAKAKIDVSRLAKSEKNGKLILVTAITPTPAGEGKTTTTIGLADALSLLQKKVAVALREPSLGPVFGVKGGATGGGFAQVAPMDDINLHFTGDFHAIGAANNLLAAMIDNHIFQGNALRFDTRKITWRRCVDMNDRQLRQIVSGLGAKNGFCREDSFEITVASEIMAIFCLAESLADLKARLSAIVVGFDLDGNPIRAKDLKAQGAMTAILRDAFKPNLAQTLGGVPAIIHGGPFANIAHGCNSVVATRTALCLADFVVTEAGFGADLGAEKFCDIKCRAAALRPDATVLVATCRALKMHGGVAKADLQAENAGAIERGIENLFKHYDNMTEGFSLPCVVALNKFSADTPAELAEVKSLCERRGISCVLCEGWEKGGEGAIDLAKKVLALCEKPKSEMKFTYGDEDSLQEKIEAVAKKIYGADGVDFSAQAKKDLQNLADLGFSRLPICIAKTQNSLSDDAKKLGVPKGWRMQVRGAKACAGAGFVVVYAGEILTMPGLPKIPAAEKIDVDREGNIIGIF